MTCGRRPALAWLRAAVTGLVLAAVATVLGPAGPGLATAAAPAGCRAWAGAPLPGEQGAFGLFGMTVLSPCDAWVVGDQSAEVAGSEVGVTLTEHWNGAAWTVVPSPSPGNSENSLVSISGVSSDDIWAVGNTSNNCCAGQTLIEHWDGSSWTVLPSPNVGSNFNGLDSVHAVSANDVWAVGSFDTDAGTEQTIILHWDGSSWTPVGGPQPGALNSVTATASNDVWAVGTVNDGVTATTLIEHWNGTSWAQVPSPAPGSSAQLGSVTATSPADAWAVGEFAGQHGAQTLALHWDGTSWTQVPTPDPAGSAGQFPSNTLAAVTASSASDAWAVGIFDSSGDGFHRRTLVLHWDGTSWAQVASPDPGASNMLNAIASGPAGDMWAVGVDGDFSTGAPFAGLVIHESPAVGGCGALAGAPPPGTSTSGDDLRGVATLSACDAWAVGSTPGTNRLEQTLIEHWDGSSWTVLPSPNVAGINNFLTGVSATSATDAWAVGFTENTSAVEQPLIEHWDGTSWTIVPGPSPAARGRELNAVRAVSATDVWAVGSLRTGTSTRTLVLHWNGTAWTKLASPSPGSAGDLAGVAATSGSDAWAVGRFFGATTQPLALHWNGTGWARARIPASIGGSLAAVSALSAGAAWAVGARDTGNGSGTLTLFWNGRRWRAVPSPNPGVTSRLFGVTASAPGNAWAVGVATTQTANQALILHWTGGSTWSAVPGPGPDGGTLFAGAGTSAGNVWAVGDLLSTTRNQDLAMHCC